MNADKVWDVVVVGCGLAGIMTALGLPESLDVLMLSKGTHEVTNSYLAQGGVAAAVGAHDTSADHFADTMRCGHYVNSATAVATMVEGASEAVDELVVRYGVAFDRGTKGYLFGLEGAHSTARILRVGDYTGKALVDTLYPHVLKRSNIEHRVGVHALALLVDGARCHGVVGRDDTGVQQVFRGRTVVLATGGLGHIFTHTTNAVGLVGDGVAMAIRAGVKTEAMAKTQFHPTGFYSEVIDDRHFLISEAVRGEGARLVDENGRSFMEGVHPKASLAPRDVVSKAILERLTVQTRPYVWLDATHLDRAFFEKRFPTIYAHCLSEGIDPAVAPIPCVPCMHYAMGGIQVDVDGRTSMPGLYAVGECAHTGVHGDNRLASNSLLEILVFSKRLASTVAAEAKGTISRLPSLVSSCVVSTAYPVSREELRALADHALGIERDHEILIETQKTIEDLMAAGKPQSFFDESAYEEENALLVMKAIVDDALQKGAGDDH